MMSERTPVVGQRRSGEAFTLEATITKVSSGGVISFTAHLRDVSERNHERDRLRESERRIRAVFDHAHTPIALLTPDGKVLEINRAGESLASDEGPLKGAPIWEAAWLGVGGATAEADGERLRAAVKSAAAGVTSHLMVPLSRDDQEATLEVRFTPIFDDAHVAYVLAEGRMTSRTTASA